MLKKGYPYKEAKDWGNISWLIPLFDIIMTGVAETVDYQMNKFMMQLNLLSNIYALIPFYLKKAFYPLMMPLRKSQRNSAIRQRTNPTKSTIFR
jgi:hypothetical protein